MHFSLTNAPANFQAFINDIPHLFLHIFAIAYLDDNPIYTNNLADDHHHIILVMMALQIAGLHLQPNKCSFY
jgi:hypothetical protein